MEKPHGTTIPTFIAHYNTHYASTGSLRAKGKPTGLPALISKVQGINSLVMVHIYRVAAQGAGLTMAGVLSGTSPPPPLHQPQLLL